ncbi:hypothetical protein CVT26_013087 [Gymnopilus dilepis]|uniref:Uncharacterized protein n=1 Tax=Gymnopilus dilepis TaxID=231916 RepID=A0A409Y4D6_9AGAR|nr:hypothetical protein CVT26_013087 [Gymnopilus dilepis]
MVHTQETAATLIPLFDARVEDLDLEKSPTAYLNAPPLKLQDVLPSLTGQRSHGGAEMMEEV